MMKVLRMKNPQPPFPFSIPTLRISDTSPTKDLLGLNLRFFIPNVRLQVSSDFLAVVISIYQLENLSDIYVVA